ncbi:hypothetical protein [Microvirga sp. TS319]|uniref:hypothetical protein n=1 Tax=Microvirga sp. TS319 TaxID=3241165 RepID=UPI00351A7C4B
MNIEDDNLTAAQATERAPAESEASEAQSEDTTTDEADTETDRDTEAERGEGDDHDEGSDEDRPKKPSRYQRLKRDRERLAAENAELRRRVLAGSPEATDRAGIDGLVEAEIGPPPQEKDFSDYLAFERALTAYETEKRIVTREVRRNVQASRITQQDSYRELVEDFRDHYEAAAQQIPEIRKAALPPITPVVEDLILRAGEKGPLIAYHLSKNPAKAADLNAMSPVEAARAVGRLEATLSLPKPNKTTRTAPPLTPVRGGGSAPLDASRMSMEEYAEARRKGRIL